MQVNHYVQTRSAYSPTWPLDANRRRLELLKRVTVPSLAAQTSKNWTWAVTLNTDDPLLEERREAYCSVGVSTVFAYWEDYMSDNPERKAIPGFPWYQKTWNQSEERKIAYKYLTEGRRIWEEVLPLGKKPMLMTRLDDDDALEPTALYRAARRAEFQRKSAERIIWVFPEGFRYFHGRYVPYTHPTNMMMTIQTWPPDTFNAMSVEHNHAPKFGVVREIDKHPSWLWIRHGDAISGKAECDFPVDDKIREIFPIDWEYLLSEYLTR